MAVLQGGQARRKICGMKSRDEVLNMWQKIQWERADTVLFLTIDQKGREERGREGGEKHGR